MDENARARKNYSLWKLKCRLAYLRSETPLIFNVYDEASGRRLYSTHRLTLAALKDSNKIIAVSVTDLDEEISEIERSIRELEDELEADKGTSGSGDTFFKLM